LIPFVYYLRYMKNMLTSFASRLIGYLERFKKYMERQKPLEFPDLFIEKHLSRYMDEVMVHRCMLIVRSWRGYRLDVSNLLIHAVHKGILPQLLEELEKAYSSKAKSKRHSSAILFDLYKRVNPWLKEHQKHSFTNPSAFKGENI